jgi:hypothetical protein
VAPRTAGLTAHFGPDFEAELHRAVIRLAENAKKDHSHFYHAPWFIEFLRFVGF